MLVGVPKEIKNLEHRFGLTPSGALELVKAGHRVIIESNGGSAIGLKNQLYEDAGAEIVDSAEELFARAELIVKVKEPQPDECNMLREGQILFTFLHLAADPVQTELLIKSGASAIAYETVTDDKGFLPLLSPMSEVAGRLSVQKGAFCLEKTQTGNGILLGGVPGVLPANVCIIGAGVVGKNAAQIAMGVGANVCILDKSLQQLKLLDQQYGIKLKTLYSTSSTIEQQLATADLVIGAVLIPGAAAPKLVTKDMLQLMKPGSVLIDVAIDQGGCFETSTPTSHSQPTYNVNGITHYCVTNMPSVVAQTATYALTNATLPYVLQLANGGLTAVQENNALLHGLNICQGKVTHKAVAQTLGYQYYEPLASLSHS